MPSRSTSEERRRHSGEALSTEEVTRLWEMYLTAASPLAPMALARLYRTLRRPLVDFCRLKGCDPELAEEVAQQAWVRLMERKPPSRTFISLIRKTAQNLAFKALRGRSATRRPRRERPEPEGDSAESAERSEVLQGVRDCVSRLNDEDRAYLIACDVDGLSRRAACELLGWNIAASTAYQRHVRIRAQVASCLKKKSLFPSEKTRGSGIVPPEVRADTWEPGQEEDNGIMKSRALVLGALILGAILPGHLGVAQTCHPRTACVAAGCLPVATSLPAVNTAAADPDGWTTVGGACGVKLCFPFLVCPCGPPLASGACIDGAEL